MILALAACSQTLDPTAEELNQASAPGSHTTESSQQQESATTAANPEALTTQLCGTWQVAHYYATSAPHYLYTPDDGTRLTITPDSIQVYAEQTLIQGFGATPQQATLLTAAYRYTPLPPATLITADRDTLRLSQTAAGLRIEGRKQGVCIEKASVESKNARP